MSLALASWGQGQDLFLEAKAKILRVEAKAKAKTLTLEAKAKAKTLTLEAKAKAKTSKTCPRGYSRPRPWPRGQQDWKLDRHVSEPHYNNEY